MSTYVISSESSPEAFADSVVEKVRGLHKRPALNGRESEPVSEEYIAEMRRDILARCVMRGSQGDPQAKFL